MFNLRAYLYSLFRIGDLLKIIQKLLKVLAIAIFDVVNSLLPPSKLPVSDKQSSIMKSECDDWSEIEISQRYNQLLAWTPPLPMICPGAVIKRCCCPDGLCVELFNCRLVQSSTTIPIPRIRRVFPDQVKYGHLILMEWIDGSTLRECWPKLSFFRRFKIVFTLRRYVLQLRKLSSGRPGPAGDEAGRCEGLIFCDQRVGPFNDYIELSCCMNHKLGIAKNKGWAKADLPAFDDSEPLVFVHHDLNMNNIMLGTDGTVWIIDWAWSGFFLRWFEHYATAAAAKKDKSPLSWSVAVPFITDPYFWQREWARILSNVFLFYHWSGGMSSEE